MDANRASPDSRPSNRPGPPQSAVTDEQLLDWALGQLGSPGREQVEQALADSAETRRRVEPVRRTLALLDRWEAEEPAEDLADRVRRNVASRRERRSAARPSIFSLAEVGAIAAALLLMALVFVPPAYRAHVMRQRLACEDNMRRIGVAMEHYANENANMLPFMALRAGENWLKPAGGRRATGTAPLFILVRQGRIRPTNLVCPACNDVAFSGDPAGLIDFPHPRHCSYSFQNLFGAAQPILRDPARVVPVLADRNPLFRDGTVCKDVSADSNSPNHRRDRGQNVLYNDGRVIWQSTPEVGINRDNIWLAGSIRSYRGVEVSRGPDDTFLAP